MPFPELAAQIRTDLDLKQKPLEGYNPIFREILEYLSSDARGKENNQIARILEILRKYPATYPSGWENEAYSNIIAFLVRESLRLNDDGLLAEILRLPGMKETLLYRVDDSIIVAANLDKLIRLGANPYTTLDLKNMGNSPLLAAIAYNKPNLAKALISVYQKQNPEFLDKTDSIPNCLNTPLMLAIKMGMSDVAIQLIDTGKVNVNHIFRDGWTALHYAAMYRLNDVIQRLVQAGANINAVNTFGAKPSDYYLLTRENILKRDSLYVKQMGGYFQKGSVVPDFDDAHYHRGFELPVSPTQPDITNLLGNQKALNANYEQYLNNRHRQYALQLVNIQLEMMQEKKPVTDFQKKMQSEFDAIVSQKILDLEPEYITRAQYPERYKQKMQEAREELAEKIVPKTYEEIIPWLNQQDLIKSTVQFAGFREHSYQQFSNILAANPQQEQKQNEQVNKDKVGAALILRNYRNMLIKDYSYGDELVSLLTKMRDGEEYRQARFNQIVNYLEFEPTSNLGKMLNTLVKPSGEPEPKLPKEEKEQIAERKAYEEKEKATPGPRMR
jgi:hypothetical protein